jgi:hypothetical protein
MWTGHTQGVEKLKKRSRYVEDQKFSRVQQYIDRHILQNTLAPIGILRQDLLSIVGRLQA